MSTTGTTGTTLEDLRINVRVKLSALWVSMLLLFAYGDIFGFFQAGQLEEIANGEISGIEVTQTFLFVVSLYIAIASAMVFLVLVLPPVAARWPNIVLAVLYIVSILASALGEAAYVWLLSVAEIAVLATIVWYAWSWPRRPS